MAIRIMDSIKTANNSTEFPVAFGDSIWLDKNKGSGTPNYASIQSMLNNDELGNGGSAIQVDLLPHPSVDELGKIYEFIGSTGTYVNGYFYECVSDGESTPTYSWVQKNVQPSNATATDVSYDNTTSELVATNVQDAIDEIKGGLGTASGKNFTDLVRPNSHELVESGSVYSAINNALSSIYTPRGELTCAELTSSLLIEDNVGNIYTMSDSGTTSALFINGAGLTINIGDNVGIIKAGADTYLFNYMGNAFDLTDYQKKDLSSPIAGASTVEGAIAQNTSDIEKIKAYTAVSNTDANTLTTTGLYYLTTGCTNIPSAYCILQVQSKNTTSISDDIAQYTVNTEGEQYYRVRVNGTWSSWKKLATSDDMTSLLKNKMSCYTWGTDKTLRAVFYEITDRGILPDITDAVGKRIIARYGNVLINRITQVNGVKNLYWDDTLVLSCPWSDDTTKLTDVLEIFVGTTAWQKFVTDEIVPSDASASNKLVTTEAIYKTLTRYWNDAGNRFIKLSNAYPTFGLRTNNYIVSCRNDETYLLVCGTTDGGDIVAPQVYLLYDGTGKLATNGFYYDSTTKEIAFMTQGYNAVSVTQISGEVKDIILSELSETNPLSNPLVITPQKLVTESELTSSIPIMQYNFENGNSITLSMSSTAYRKVCIYNQTEYYEFVVHEWGAYPRYHWIVGTELPSTITASYSGYRLTLSSTAQYRIVIEAPEGKEAIASYT